MAIEMRDWVWSKPWLVLCEGKDDQAFFVQLIKHLKLEDKFDVKFPCVKEDPSGGNSKFGKYLLTQMETTRGIFSSKVQAVLIVSDSDDDPDASFRSIAKSLADTNKLPVPKKVMEVAKRDGSPHVAICLLPFNGKGGLETYCLEAAYRKFGLKDHVEQLITNTPANGWEVTPQSKAKIHTILATTCKQKPLTSLAYHWETKPEYHIPVDDASFADVSKVLAEFEQLIA